MSCNSEAKSVTISSVYAAIVPAPVGILGIRISGGRLSGIDFMDKQEPVDRAPDADARAVLDQLFRYFEDPAWRFDLPLAIRGTAFQRRVWQSLRNIPSGSTRSYGELARELASSARAVGGACRRNPIPIVVPCHRVTAANGVGGFMGERDGTALAIKRWLLEHERTRQ